MDKENETRKRSVGRPREFDRSVALRAAMTAFWKNGYEGTSLVELTEVMGISRPTLYAAFGDKETLLREAVQIYTGLYADLYAQALNQPTSRQVVEAWLRATGGVRPEADVPAGCLLVQGALGGSEASLLIQQEFAAILHGGTDLLEKRLQQAKSEGDLPGSWEPGPLAQYLSALAFGLAVQSSSGVSSAILNATIDQIMANWPATQSG